MDLSLENTDSKCVEFLAQNSLVWVTERLRIRDEGMEKEALPSGTSPTPANGRGGDIRLENPHPPGSHLETF